MRVCSWAVGAGFLGLHAIGLARRTSKAAGGSRPASVVVGGLLAGGRRALTWEGRDHLGDRRVVAVLLHYLDHEALLYGLVIAIAELDLALDAVELDRLEGGTQRAGICAVGLLDAGLDHLHRLPGLAVECVGQGAVVLLA